MNDPVNGAEMLNEALEDIVPQAVDEMLDI